VEDWGYQYHVRHAQYVGLADHDPTPQQPEPLKAAIEQGLQAYLDMLPGFAGAWRIRPGSVRLPWNRLFEVDFDLEPV
jgi:hypothetical protein